MDEPRRVVIVGSGPTAIGAALRLQELIDEGKINAEVTILEAANRVGGLASSVTTPRGFTFDLGVHVTGQSKYHDFLKTIDEAVGDWNYIPRCVQASMHHVFPSRDTRDCYVPYPVQDSISHFPGPIREQCEQELEELASKDPIPSCANFGEFALSTFGETLTKLFIRPYNEKILSQIHGGKMRQIHSLFPFLLSSFGLLTISSYRCGDERLILARQCGMEMSHQQSIWTVPLESMAACWVEGRVPRPAKRKDNNENEEGRKAPAVVFRYPSRLRGVGEMWKRVVRKLPDDWIRLEACVERIDTEDKRVTLANGFSLPYDIIISTIPIDKLGRICGLAPDLPLKHSKVVLVGIGLARPQPIHTEPLSWAYYPQPETIFYRVTFISNFNEHLTPNVALYWSVLCEIGFDSEREVDETTIAERTIQDLIREGVINSDSSIIDRWVHVLPYGYPIPTVNRNETLAKTQQLMEAHEIYSRGRFGSWLYEVANQDHSYTMGREVVGRIFMGESETVHVIPK